MFIGRLSTILVCAALTVGLAAQEPSQPKPPAGAQAPAKPVFVIVTQGDQMSVMSKEDATKKEKQLAADYTKAKEQYDKDKKAAEAAGQKFDRAAPVKASLTILSTEYPDKGAADAALKKMQDEKAKKEKEKKPGDKGGDKAPEAPKGK